MIQMVLVLFSMTLTFFMRTPTELSRSQLIMGVNCPYLRGFGQLRESSRYGYTDNFGKNDVYQVGYGKRGHLRVHVFLPGIPL